MKRFLAAAGIGAALTAGAVAGIGPASADVFTQCPSGHDGVVGGHTSCAFADIVAGGYYERGASFSAYSPVMQKWYDVACAPGYFAHFIDGSSRIAAECYAGDNAEVVVW